MKTSKKSPKVQKTAKNANASNPFLDMIIEGINNLEQKDWEFYLKSEVNFEPKNLFSNKPYVRYNRLALIIDMMIHQYQLPFYATFKQISQAGGVLKKGSKSIIIQYFNYDIKHKETQKRITLSQYLQLSEDEKKKYFVNSFVKNFRVFNVANIANFADLEFENITDETAELEDINLSVNAEELITKLKTNKGLKLVHEPVNVASYNPSSDVIRMPETKQFKDDVKYYSTLFHEMIHWTGHTNRLDRFSKDSYAFEELTAEIGSILLYFDFNFKTEFVNSLVYLKGWLKKTKSENQADTLSKAFKLANQAVSFIYK